MYRDREDFSREIEIYQRVVLGGNDNRKKRGKLRNPQRKVSLVQKERRCLRSVSRCVRQTKWVAETFRCLTVQVGWELKIKHWCEQNGVIGDLDKCNLRGVRRFAPYKAGGRGIGREWEVGRMGHQERNSCLRNFDANGIKEMAYGRERVKVLFLLRYKKPNCPRLACLS